MSGIQSALNYFVSPTTTAKPVKDGKLYGGGKATGQSSGDSAYESAKKLGTKLQGLGGLF